MGQALDFKKETARVRKSVKARVRAFQNAGDAEMRNPVTSLAIWAFVLASGVCSIAGVIYSYKWAAIMFVPLAGAAIILGARYAVHAARAATREQRAGCIAILVLCTAVNAWGEHRALESLNDYVRAPYERAVSDRAAVDAELAQLRPQIMPVPVMPTEAAALAVIPAARLKAISAEAEKVRAANLPVQLKIDAATSRAAKIVVPHEPPGQIAPWAMPIIIAASLIIHTLGFWAIGNAPAPVVARIGKEPAPEEKKEPVPVKEPARSAASELARQRWSKRPPE